jgi:serine protease Do
VAVVKRAVVEFLMKRTLTSMVMVLLVTAGAGAQPATADLQRSSPKILTAFRDVVEQPSQYTVRVRADGKDAALGIIVEPDGWVLTKASELKGKLTCRLKGGREETAQVVGVHEDYDVALLKIKASDLPSVFWRPTKEARVGQWVASPGPDSDPIAVGVVSVGTRKLKIGDQPPRNLGSKSGYLGVMLDEGEGGARIVAIMNDSPAARARLHVGDIVIEAGGKKILDNESLINAVQRHHPGEELTLRVRRGGEELELKAVLGRPPQGLFGNPQDRFGGALSSRRGGFPTILQHDSVLRPSDCGGPLVDLDGRALGINIARAGRTETYAVPSEDILPLLADLKSGKLAPTVEVTGPLSPRPRPGAANALLHDVNRLTTQDVGQGGRHSRAYALELTEGQRVEIDLESIDFDAYLIVEDKAGTKLAEDNNGGGDTNARLAFLAPRTDTYRIIVTTRRRAETGNFELTVKKK